MLSTRPGLFDDAASLRATYEGVDWAAGPLGPVEGWTQSLRTTVSICLASQFPILLWWGPELTMLYNEAYRPLIGDKHPAALGTPGREVFPEIWDMLQPMLGAVRAGHEATYSEDQLMLLERRGFAEECYFTYSVSSVVDDDGSEGGIFTAALETTSRVVDQRRLDLLRRLGALADTLDLEEVSSRVLEELRTCAADLPEVDLLLPAAAGGLVPVEPAGALADAAAASGDGGAQDGHAEPEGVLHLPVALADGRAGVLAVRLSEKLVPDEPYVAFVTSVSRAVSAALGPAAAYRAERSRADAQAALAQRLEGLVHVARLLGDTHTEDGVLQVVTGPAASVLGAAGALLVLHDADGARLRALGTSFFTEAVQADVAGLPLHLPLPVVHTARTGERLLLPDRDAALDRFPGGADLYDRTGTEASAALPLRVGGAVIGSLALAWKEARAFTTEDAELLEGLAALCAQTLDRARALAAERASAAVVEKMSETLQRSLLTSPPQPEGLQIAVRYQPAKEQAHVGGDWYDAFAVPDGSTALVIGDVAGHDRDAAAAMGQVRNLLRATAYAVPGSPAAVLTALDAAMAGLRTDTLATALLASVSALSAAATVGVDGAGDADGAPGPGGRVLTWSSAGHPPPALLLPDGTVTLLEGGEADLLLGLDAGARRDAQASLPEGATLLLYTDGLVERRGEGLDTGLDRLRGVLADLHGLALERLCDELLTRLLDPRAGQDAQGGQGGRGPSTDDVALLALRVNPAPSPRQAEGEDRGAHLDLGADPVSVPRARRFAVGRCRALGHPQLADAVALAVSEVVTNAVRHGRGPVRVVVARAPGGVRVEVADGDRRLPVGRDAEDDDEGGRGLALVAVLAQAWGAYPVAGGKVVWLELREAR